MKKWRNFWGWIVILSFLSCGSREGDMQGFSAQPLVRFAPFDYFRQLPGCETDTMRCARLSVVLPRAAGPSDSVTGRINDTLSAYLRRSLSVFDAEHTALPETVEMAAQQFFADYRDMLEHNPRYRLPWWMEVEGRLNWQSAKVASMELTHHSYAGGAHPTATTTFLNFDVETGRAISLTDLVVDFEALRLLAEKEFRRVRGVDPGQSLQEAGFFWGRTFDLPENFGLRDDGLILHYNSYEAASYAEGATSLLIPYDELEGVLLLSKIK